MIHSTIQPTLLAPRRTHKVDMKMFRISTYFAFQFSSVAQSCPTLCDPMNCSMPGLPVTKKKKINTLGGTGIFPLTLCFYNKGEILDTKDTLSDT